MSELIWPERPTCHDRGYMARVSNYVPVEWRDPRPRRQDPETPDSDPYEQTWRTCSYCGSIHPEDLYGMLVGRDPVERKEFVPSEEVGSHSDHIAALAEHYRREQAKGVRVGGSDWKYGWPHKFYIDGIPNPVAGQRTATYMSTGTPNSRERTLYSEGTAPATQRAKWYNDHLQEILDLDHDTFTEFARVLSLHSGVTWRALEKDGRLVVGYSAPYAGYQG